MMLINMFMIIILISLLLMLINFMISKKEILDLEKNSSFECGFESMSLTRLPFSIQFYLISILFLVFDIEILFLFPMIELFNYLNIFEWIYIMFLIIFVLYIGLEFEKNEGSLKWVF
uniref:NADH-ubiquinone oxidoreductase chain 3 n=1 Tax=Pambolus sp. QL-2013 TaxID=1421597 RepID=A0A0A6ZKZ9_9HYME|nr:NADH dehydrogenase subunit 3 [Pambolus sp. QL-2013]